VTACSPQGPLTPPRSTAASTAGGRQAQQAVKRDQESASRGIPRRSLEAGASNNPTTTDRTTDPHSQCRTRTETPDATSKHGGRVHRKTLHLAAALQHDDEEQRESARQALRGFIDRIVIPADGLLQVVGNFGEMLTAAGGPDGAAAVAYVGCGGTQPAEFGVLLDGRLAGVPAVRLTPLATPASSECQGTSAPPDQGSSLFVRFTAPLFP